MSEHHGPPRSRHSVAPLPTEVSVALPSSRHETIAWVRVGVGVGVRVRVGVGIRVRIGVRHETRGTRHEAGGDHCLLARHRQLLLEHIVTAQHLHVVLAPACSRAVESAILDGH
eukprot:scaffold70487_cov58-Phaeocystis_antarctica.AAC.2